VLDAPAIVQYHHREYFAISRDADSDQPLSFFDLKHIQIQDRIEVETLLFYFSHVALS